MRGQRLRAFGATRLQPIQHRLFALALDAGGAHAGEAFHLAVVVLERVLPAAHGVGVLDLDVLVGLAGGQHHRHQFLEAPAGGRIGPGRGGVEIGGQRIATGAARVTGDHHEVALAQRLVGDLQPVLRLERHVVLAVRGRLAVLAHVGAVEAEVAGVARPHPVVDLAAVIAHAARRRVGQAHVLDLDVLEQPIGISPHEAVQAAARAGVGFASADQLLLEVIDGLGARQRIRRGGDRGLDLRGDVGDFVEHVDARVRAAGELIGHGRRIEAEVDQVALGGGVQLDRTVRAVVVGDHQALWRDEAGRAAAQRHHCAHRVAGEVGQLLRVQFQAGFLQRAGDLRQLLRHPHAFVGIRGGRRSHHQCGDRRGKHRLLHRPVLSFVCVVRHSLPGITPPAGSFPSAGAAPDTPWPATSAGNACRRGSRACSAGRTSSWR